MAKKGNNEIKLMLIEDNRLLRDGITAMLEKEKNINVVETIGDGKNILKILRKFKPDVMLLDLGLKNRSSLNLVKSVKKKFSEVKIIIMDLIPTQDDVLDFVKEGVSGFILKDATVKDFVQTIRKVANGIKVLPTDLTGSLFSQIAENALKSSKPSSIINSVRMTKRERQVVELISDGFTNKEIAQKLYLSPYTVKSHVHNILEKLALNTRVQIAKLVHDSQEEIDSAKSDISLLDE